MVRVIFANSQWSFISRDVGTRAQRDGESQKSHRILHEKCHDVALVEVTPTLALPLFRRRGKELDSKGAKGHGTLAHSVA